MKNIKMDTKGHIISYESDSGVTITDYKQLAKSAGLTGGDYERMHSSGGISIHLPDNMLIFFALLITAGVMGLFTLLAWLLFTTWFAIVLTVGFGLTLIILLLVCIYG